MATMGEMVRRMEGTLCRIASLDNGRRASGVGLAARGAAGKVGR